MAKSARYFVTLFQQTDGQHGDINRSAVRGIQRQLDGVIRTAPAQTEIDLWVDSPGGDGHATYKLVHYLRSRARLLRAVIPDFAKSAATLLVIGVDQIYMEPGADLGPLDVQISHPDRENEVISALDVAGALDYLHTLSYQMAIMGGAMLVKYTGLPRAEVLKATLGFAAEFLQPCVAKIDPQLTRRAVYQLKVAERYAMALLGKRNVPSSQRLSPDQARALVHRLVNDYPVHEFVISRDEAAMLGLPVLPASKYDRWKVVKAEHDRFMASDGDLVRVQMDAAAIGKQDRPERRGRKPRIEQAGRRDAGKEQEAPVASNGGGNGHAANRRRARAGKAG